MQIDALRPLKASLEEDELAQDKATLSKTPYSEEEIEEATQFLRLSVRYSICAFLGLGTELFHSTRSTVLLLHCVASVGWSAGISRPRID